MSQPQYLVDTRWLAQNLNDSRVVIVDCRFRLPEPDWGVAQYYQSHIPGAYYLDLNRDLSSSVRPHGGRHPLPNIDQLAWKFAEMGIITNETLVVAYDNSRFAFASRLWWLLRYMGHEPVVLLDGGWDSWCQANYPVDDAIPPRQKGDFTYQLKNHWLADIDTVKLGQSQKNVVIVDSRDRDRYLGIREPIDPIAGSIAGSVNSPWKQVSNESGYLQPLAEQQQLWTDYQQAAEIVVYCGSGVTACVNWWSLARSGFKNLKLYSGGWSDWCSYLREN